MSEAGAAEYRVALPEFEGPLDLLLHLCKTHELDIVNIPIAFVTEKYLEYLEVMEAASVDVAADYLVMAATLAYLKSRELVPTPEPIEASSEEEEAALDPREELIRRLLEYQKYKDAAERLSSRPIEGRTIFGRGVPIPAGEGGRPLAEQSVWKLIEAFGSILAKSGKAKSVHNVVVDRLPVGARINQILDRLEAQQGSVRFDTLFDLDAPEEDLRNQVVVTLLAILELAKLKVVRVLQAEVEGPIESSLFVTTVEGASIEAARRVAVTVTAEDERAASEEAASELAGAELAASELAASEEAASEVAASEVAASELGAFPLEAEPPEDSEVPAAPPEASDSVTSPLETMLPEAIPQETEIESKTEAAPPGPTEETNDEA